MDSNPSNADLDMIEALLATMQQNSGQLYDEVDDDDDEDYEDDDEDDDDEDGYYGEHNINTLLNPYGGDSDGNLGDGDADCPLPTVHTMNFLQGLLNMNSNNSAIPGMAEIEAAIGSSMGGAMGNDGDAGSFLPSMQSILPNMGSNMVGALAGAFAGGMMQYGQDGQQHDDYDDDDDDDDEDDDDDVLTDEEDEEDDEDDDDDDDDDEDDDLHEYPTRGMDLSGLAAGTAGAIGGLMAANFLSNQNHHHQRNFIPDSYQQSQPNPSIVGHRTSNSHLPAILATAASINMPPLGFSHPNGIPHSQPSRNPMQNNSFPNLSIVPCRPNPMPQQQLALPCSSNPSTTVAPLSSTPTKPQPSNAISTSTHHPVYFSKPIPTTVSSSNTLSGGTVCKGDPLAALMAGAGGAIVGSTIMAPIVSNLLGNSGGTTVVNRMNSPPNPNSSMTLVSNDSFNSSSRTLTDGDTVDDITTALAFTSICSPQKEHTNSAKITELHSPLPKGMTGVSQQMLLESKNNKEDCEDDKASLGSASVSGSETSGGGKSDTESVGKKTPSPVPEGSESTNSQDVGSCASITDLASATESMRDSDTDNHSEVHNVTANLSDLDNDVHDTHKEEPVAQYQVGGLPVVIEHPTYGWGSMLGLDRAKEALKDLFVARTFPKVFEGTEGSCKGVLLFGPSGSGKTCLARALAKEANNALFVGISARYLVTSHPLDAIKFVRLMFDHARLQKPAVILFDEIEALSFTPTTESAMLAKEEILAQVRGQTTLPPGYPRDNTLTSNEGVMVLGTTNQPWLVEEKMRKLFAYNIHVKLPGEKARHELFRMFLQNLPHHIKEEEFTCLVDKSDGYSAADINTAIRQASQMVSREPTNAAPGHPRLLTFDDLMTVLTQYQCRFDDGAKQKYSTYIRAATHKSEQSQDGSKDSKKDRPKGVKRFSHRIAKSLAAAVLAVID